MDDLPTLDDIKRRFPHWHAWHGIAGLVYAARRMTSPPAVKRAEDTQGLITQIRQWEAEHK